MAEPHHSEAPIRAAVLAPVFESNGELYLVFTERSHEMPVHSGQVAFPGGVCRKYDASPLATALREAEEEIGLRSADVTVMASLPEVHTMTSGFVIDPFLARIPENYPFVLEPREVASIFFASLSELRSPSNRKHVMRTLSDGTEREVPAFIIGSRVIWGATEVITREVLTTRV